MTFYEKNREQLIKKQIEYNKKNREKILEYKKERVNCTICNKEFARSSLSRHKKRIHSS